MRQFEQTIDAACRAEEIPGVVLMATDRGGKFTYARAFGKRSVREGADQSPLALDTVMWIASCTKVVTSIAVMQCVERGQLRLDVPIYDILPELRNLPVITSIGDSGEPEYSGPHKNPITLRHLLTHTSGMTYDEVHPYLIAWHKHRGTRPKREGNVDSPTGFGGQPLVFEPGESWSYGPSVDWAGLAVERVNGGVSLQDYCEEHIFRPLGARDIVFSNYMAQRPDMKARLADMSKRDPARPGKIKRSNAKLQFSFEGGCFGGGGLFSDAPSFLKVLRGILNMETDGVLLKKRETVDEFFRPCLGDQSREMLNDLMHIREARDGMGGIPLENVKDWGLGGILNMSNIPGGRSAGTMTWGGLPNLSWFIDRKAGVTGFYAGQMLPPADAQSAQLAGLFEKGIYEMIKEGGSKL